MYNVTSLFGVVKHRTGTNVMTTTSENNGECSLESYNLVSSATWSFAGEEVELSYGSGIKSRGFIHVSSGSLAGANKCANSRYEWSSKPSGRITWSAPSDETASVTISVATAGGYGRISRQKITLTKIEAPTTQAPTPAPTTTKAPTTQAPTPAPTTKQSATTQAPTPAPTTTTKRQQHRHLLQRRQQQQSANNAGTYSSADNKNRSANNTNTSSKLHVRKLLWNWNEMERKEVRPIIS